MNEKLKELAEQSGMEWDTHIWCWLANPPHLEKFAEFVRQDERASTKPEQASNEPPDYVEPPTSDYHNGWEEGFEAAKNLFKVKNT
jgi:hypothetical protein